MTVFQLIRDPRDEARVPLLMVIGWALSLVGWGFVGLIVAGRGWRGASAPLCNNYRYMVRTVFIGMLYAAPAVIALWLTGVAALAAVLAVPVGLWHFARCVEGLGALVLDRPVDPETWLL